MNRIDELYDELNLVIDHVELEKPNDRSELDRRFAIVIADLEKVKAYFYLYIFSISDLVSVSD